MGAGVGRVAFASLFVVVLACAGRTAMTSIEQAEGYRVDGRFEEWAGAPIVATNGREVEGPDLREVRAVVDEEALHLLLDFERPINLQAMEGTLRLALDGDGDARTGERVAALDGADLIIDLSTIAPGVAAGAGKSLRFAGDTLHRSVYDAGLAYAPTHASARFEVDLARVVGDRVLLPGRALRGLIVMLDAAGAPLEVFGPFLLDAPEARAARSAREPLSLTRPAGVDVRVLAWNVGDRAPAARPAPFRRILRAADADVILLDEINPALDEAALRDLLPSGESWTIVLGTGGGRQRTAVASRLPLTPSSRLARVAWPDSASALLGLPMPAQVRRDLEDGPVDGLPAVGAVGTVGSLRVLYVPVDLSCCGRAGSAEDRARTIAAAALNEAIRAALEAGEADAAVVGGDLNLVGSTMPLEVLRAGLDSGGQDLRAANLVTPDRRTFSTWRSPGPFAPGRLDWVLYPASALEQVGGMVLDVALLAAEERTARGLLEDDAQVTDHLPLVVDLALRRDEPTPGRRDPSNR